MRRIWTTPQQLWDDFIEYANTRANHVVERLTKQGNLVTLITPLPITIEGFCVYKGISRQSFYRYKDYDKLDSTSVLKPVCGDNDGNDGNDTKKINKSYCDTFARIEQYIEDYTNTNAAIGNFEGRWFELYAKNKFGYKNQVEVQQDTAINVQFNIPRPQLMESEDIIKIED